MVSWTAIKKWEDDRHVKYLTPESTWSKRPVWSPMITCEYIPDPSSKNKWKLIQLDLYDVIESRYIKWNYQFCLDRIEDGTIDIIK